MAKAIGKAAGAATKDFQAAYKEGLQVLQGRIVFDPTEHKCGRSLGGGQKTRNYDGREGTRPDFTRNNWKNTE
jgi:hypothetical protein